MYTKTSLQFFSSPEGRVVKKGSNYEYEYAISDHQGNTRIVFAAYAQPADTYKATYETNTQATEVTTFQNYPSGAWRSALNLYDHTDAGTTATYSQLLNGAANGQVGLAKTLKVFPGDVIRADVYAKYFNPTSTTSNIAGFATALTAAFGLSPASVGDGLKAFQGLTDFGSVIVANNGSPGAAGPKAFITILQFDQEFNFVDAAWDQISATAQETGGNVAHDLMTQQVTIKEPGYVYIYVSNENPTLVDVYFDDLTITHTKTPVIQYNEYYPFGLQTANSWTRENNSNNFLYNEGTELNSTTGMYDLFYRNYDPALGRFHQVDPMADSYGSLTPYNFANNDPVYFNDPIGLAPSTPYSPKPNDGSGGMIGGTLGGSLAPASILFDQYTGGSFQERTRESLSARSFAQADYHFQTVNITNALTGYFNSYGYSPDLSKLNTTIYLSGGSPEFSDRENMRGTGTTDVIFLNFDDGLAQGGFSLTGVPSKQHPGGNFGIPEVGLTHTMVSAWYEKNAYLIKYLTGAVPKVVTTFGKGLGVVGLLIAVAEVNNNINTKGYTTNTIVKGVIGLGLGVAGTVAAFTSPVWGTAAAVGGIAYGALDYFGVVDFAIDSTKGAVNNTIDFFQDVKYKTIQGLNGFQNIGY